MAVKLTEEQRAQVEAATKAAADRGCLVEVGFIGMMASCPPNIPAVLMPSCGYS